MTELRDLYQAVILDHNNNPRNYGKLTLANRHAEGVNPLCGDQVNVFFSLDDDAWVKEVGFEGRGCAICMASASIMTETVKHLSIEQADQYVTAFCSLAGGEKSEVTEGLDLSTLKVLAGVKAYPARIKCATLAWHTARSALSNGAARVTTET
ncbi:MAG: SUF system NifU family Fe-S cluster assembly protein [Pseudomonadota bacterium]|nr:SUF system NifU family Fe-S cluster assembly protein [Pseudomonadota bacterium]